LRWQNMRVLAEDVLTSKRYDSYLGPRVAEDLRQSFVWMNHNEAIEQI